MSIKPLSTLTRPLVILLKISMGISIASFVWEACWIAVSHLAPGFTANTAPFPLGALVVLGRVLVLALGISEAIVFLVLGITFLRWIYRANKNLHALSSAHMEFSPGWAVGWYFIPIADLWKPYQAMKEISTVAHRWTGTDNSFLGWWWLLWLVYILGSGIRINEESLFTGTAAGAFVGYTVYILLCWVAIMLVSDIAGAYEANYAALERTSTDNLPAPPAVPSASG